MDWSVRDNPAEHRYEVARGEEVGGWVDYDLRDDVLRMTHAEVDPGYKGEGLGSALASGALDAARARGLSVVPACPFIAEYIQRHTEYADLVPPVRRAEFGLG